MMPSAMQIRNGTGPEIFRTGRRRIVSMGLVIILLLLLSTSVNAVTVRMETVFGDIDVELLDDIAPLTVQNFLNYVDDGDYTDSFIHRNGLDSLGQVFVVQGGGFTFDPALGPFIRGQGIQDVPTDPPVQNEFQLSNLRGTVAMAKVGTDPNSATSQWFFNVTDNTFLDTQNGGFTVFGRVLGDGMDIVDQIAAVPVQAFFQPFNELPLIDFTTGQTITSENVVFVRRVFRLGILQGSASSLNFGKQQAGQTTLTRSVFLSLTGGEGTTMVGAIAVSPTSPFSIVGDGCSGVVLGSGGVPDCEIRVQFSPGTIGDFSASLSVPSDSAVALPDIQLRGEGVADLVAVLEPSANSLAFGSILQGDSKVLSVSITSIGGTDLVMSSIAIEGDGAGQYSQSNDCSVVPPGQLCTVSVTFSPDDSDAANAELVIQSNDGEQAEIRIGLSGATLAPQAISVPDTLRVGDSLVGQARTGALQIRNAGDADLAFTSIELEGSDVGLFTLEEDCGVLGGGQSCTATVTFVPDTLGVKAVSLRIRSDDPERGEVVVSIDASGASDLDQVRDDIEDGHPSKNADGRGDGNGDGIADALQADVTSLLNPAGQYVTLVASDGAEFDTVQALDLEGLFGTDTPPDSLLPPSGFGTEVNYDQGFYVFNLVNVSASSNVTMIFPDGVAPTDYVKFGITPDNLSLHWFLFNFDGTVGAEFDNNRVTLHLVDGGIGDGDLTVNGAISDPGGPAFVTTTFVGEKSGGNFGCRAVPGQGSMIRVIGDIVVLGMFILMLFSRRGRAK